MKNYKDIINDFNGKVPYHFQLELQEWYEKRNKIVFRDKHTCQICKGRCIDDYIPVFVSKTGNLISKPGIYTEVGIKKTIEIPYTSDTIEYSETNLQLVIELNPLFPHVHHRYYVIDNLAWDYPDEALILLCHKCHSNFHMENSVPIYLDYQFGKKIKLTPCHRCFGAGHFPEYNHVDNGICFRCGGTRYEELFLNNFNFDDKL